MQDCSKLGIQQTILYLEIVMTWPNCIWLVLLHIQYVVVDYVVILLDQTPIDE